MSKGIRTGYFPFVAKDFHGQQVLVRVFIDEDGDMFVDLCSRDRDSDSWSAPVDAELPNE